MTCHNCRIECKRKGRDRKGNQRYQCHQCRKTFQEPREKPLEGMYTPLNKAEQILKLLVEGASISTIERVTDVHHTTILKLLVLVGEKCNRLMGRLIVNVPVKDVQCDEIWGFCQKKEANKWPFRASFVLWRSFSAPPAVIVPRIALRHWYAQASFLKLCSP